MTLQISNTVKTLYDQDYHLWVETTIQQLREGALDAIDWENLIEEVADLSRRQRDKLSSLLTKLWEHLLKLGYWQSEQKYNAAKWKSEIRNFRLQLKKLLKNSPSLKPYLREIFDDCYQDARKIISDLTQLPLEAFPVAPIATPEQVLDENWFPLNP